ncbi:hypothetical protein HX021_19220 [Sphingobacterium sp. N143]|uniref:hypothetical protein n=1 Tax=Sphingobacterium sp. N143 TaxID=2746727 RepID=UPI002578DA93|nr:hypothetical protein [Sphingobacterium sp. N143]MDM1296420.1 hypothetical protein [Sphingobacterium sp. N143]
MKSLSTTYKLLVPLLISGITLFSSCQKEYEIEPTPFTEITSFKIPYHSGSDTIVAAVAEGIIYVSWPGSSEWPIPETVSPIISVAKNASVSPASGTAVTLKDGLQYRVKAQDGTIKTYTIKLSNGAILPSFVDEETPLNITIGGTYALQLRNLAADGSDSLFLVNDQNKLFKLITVSQTQIGGFQFIADQYDGSGIPIGDYYLQVSNKYQIPVRSNKKLISVTSNKQSPYPYFNHNGTWAVKRGDVIDIPTRHLVKESSFSNIYFSFVNADGYPDLFSLEFLALSKDLRSIQVKIPMDAPTGISSSPSGGIIFTMNNDWSTTLISPYYPYPIKVVE